MIIENLSFFFLILFFFYLIVKKNNKITNILILGILIRFLFLSYNLLINEIAIDYANANIWSSKGVEYLEERKFIFDEISGGCGDKVYFYSCFISYIFEYFGSNALLVQIFGILIGILIIVITYEATLLVWNNEKIAFNCALFVSLFPIFINYSILTLREVYIQFFIILQIYLFIKFLKEKNYLFSLTTIIIINFVFIYLHGAIFLLGPFLFIIYLFIYFSKKKNFYKSLFFLLIIISLSIFFLYFNDHFLKKQIMDYFYRVPYIGILSKELNLISILEKIRIQSTYYVRGTTSFPEFVNTENYLEFLTLLPLRMIIFLTGPYFWDLKIFSLKYILASLEGTIYFILILVLIKNLKKILKNKYSLILLCIFIFLTILFSSGAGNYGSAIRHRSKFAVLLIIINSPFITNYWINFTKKIKIFFNKK